MESFELVNNMINGKTAEIRRLAAEELFDQGVYSPDILKAFAYGLKDIDRGVKDICSQALSNIPDDYKATSAEFLAPYIDSENIELRNLAGDILIKLGIFSVEPVLVYTKHADHYVRQFAVDILAQVGDKRIIEDLLFLLNDENSNVVSSTIDALGNLGVENSLPTLERIYFEKEEFRPMIIEAFRKIGGPKVEAILLNKLSTESDMFLQIACVDALAFVGSDVSICYDLLAKLPKVQDEVQGILLKTIFAIAFRNEVDFQLPVEYRYIAVNALNDTEADIRIAGLIALGNEYFEDELSSLIDEVLRYNNDTQQLIFSNLLSNCKPDILEKFLREYSAICHYDQKHIEFFTLLLTIYANANEDNIERLFRILFELIIVEHSGFSIEVIEVLYNVDKVRATEWIKQLFYDIDFVNRNEIIDIIYKFKFEDFYDDLKIASIEHNEFGKYALEILLKIEEDRIFVEQEDNEQDVY